MEILNLLLNKDGNIHTHYPNGSNPLFEVAINGNVEMAKFLIGKGVFKVNERNPNNLTVLMLAAYHGHSNIIEILINSGAEVDTIASNGTALSIAIQKGHIKVVEILLKAGADPNRVIEGKSMIQLAGACKANEIVKLLLDTIKKNNNKNNQLSKIIETSSLNRAELPPSNEPETSLEVSKLATDNTLQELNINKITSKDSLTFYASLNTGQKTQINSREQEPK